MKKILIAIDGSEHSQKALEEGRKFAEAFCSEVILLNVVNDFKHNYFHESVYLYEQTKESFEQQGKNIIEKAGSVFDGFCGTLITEIKIGDPAEQIINAIETIDPDLIVMGSKGLTGIKKVVIGSVSDKVLHHTNKPILIVR
ncbi:universal stress protein [Geosporobacter ferrireducens]|uniref:UspA domain-containing protein n=1 Tax=Geosporobacter ferrireducens TaxID=1424294 RepID=A0A1D8GDX2_9FIRM|nr:universal stress protein [Geosporobacter ferrireducens]AOT69106.1 hypothetical protein Gferi_05760 [Geosporobacter ferrireducens]